jgi:TonB family protein
MAAALILLVVTLTAVLYHDRDFWFPDDAQTQDDNDQASAVTPATNSALPQHSSAKAHSKEQRQAEPSAPSSEPADETRPPITVTRTVLPPLEVEVIAGNSHRKLRPGSNTVQIDLERGSAASRATPSVPADPEPVPAAVTSKAAEHVQVSRNAANLVTHSVNPNYPTLARQMKVQGSVILQAIIGRDGLIQDLQIVSGPPILAGAAREAVKQWHFKPHYLGADPVETQAKITVNFSISTN